MRIKFQNLSKKFNDERVLRDINFDEEITSLAIIGASGGGKSTLLKIIGGLMEIEEGAMFINGREIKFEENELLEYRKNIGFIFQQNGLFKHMTVLENIVHPLVYVHKYDKKVATDIAIKLLKRFGLEGERDKKPSELSGGQIQRAGIIRALAPKPKFLLFDEPTSALDPEYTIEVLDIIKELKNEGIEFIIVTHEMGFAKSACDKVLFLYNGDILEYGESSEIFHSPKTEELQRFLSKLLEYN